MSVNGIPKCATRSRCHPGYAHGVGTIGCDRDVEHDVVEAQHLAHVGTGRRVIRQREDAVMVVTETELAHRGAQHPFRHDTADLAPLDLEVARQHRADTRERNHHAGFDVRCAADDSQLPGAEVDVGQADPIRIGMRDDIETRATTTPLTSRPGSSIASTSRPS